MPAHHHRFEPEAHFFSGRGAAIYDRVSRFGMGWLYRRIARDVAAGRPATGAVVDLGCGPGHATIEIARRSPSLTIIGIDPSADMVELARANAAKAGLDDRVRFEVASSEATDLPDGSAALVVSSLSVHHWADVGGGLAEVMRVLQPGGEFWIYEPAFLMGRQVQREVRRQARALIPEPALSRRRMKLGPFAVLMRLRLRERPV